MALWTQAKDAVLSLLAITFEPGPEPSGTVVLTFSANCTIRLNVEYLDLHLKDLGRSLGHRTYARTTVTSAFAGFPSNLVS